MSDGTLVVDVTLRDGGYVNQHSWSLSEASEVVAASAAAGIPYCEVGYFRPRRHEVDGKERPAACSPPQYLSTLKAQNPQVGLVVMVHARDVDLSDYETLRDNGVSMVRMPAKSDVLRSLPAHVEAAKSAGLEATVNLIRVSEVRASEVADAARLALASGADAFYLADSNGSLFPEDVTALFEVVSSAASIPMGFHAHDGLSLAFSNSLAALRAGCSYLDASLAGMGKGGGNLSLELLAGYLRSRGSGTLNMAPLARAAATVLKPWKEGVAARCESMASSLLNMNIDEIAGHGGNDPTKELVTLVDATSAVS
jgi:4-hydroxy 2-oxovalerate aldolase